MEKNQELKKELQLIASLQRDLNLVTAFLLLTGQITILGVFVTPGEFHLSLSGPLFGGQRVEGRFCDGEITNTIIDIIDVIIAILLIIDQIQIVSMVIGPGRFSLIVTGPIFGAALVEPTLPCLKRSYKYFRTNVLEHFHVDPSAFKNI